MVYVEDFRFVDFTNNLMNRVQRSPHDSILHLLQSLIRLVSLVVVAMNFVEARTDAAVGATPAEVNLWNRAAFSEFARLLICRNVEIINVPLILHVCGDPLSFNDSWWSNRLKRTKNVANTLMRVSSCSNDVIDGEWSVETGTSCEFRWTSRLTFDKAFEKAFWHCVEFVNS